MKFRNETHNFEYHLDSTFFALKEHSLYSKGSIDVNCLASKQETTVQLDISLHGTVDTDCERCLKPIGIPVNTQFTTVYKLTLNKEKFGEENYLSINDQLVNIYDLIYENIVLSMPSRLICANGTEKNECSIDIEESADEGIDPRWEALKKLKQ